MMTLRCTRKLLKKLNLPPVPGVTPATTALGDWCANLYDALPQPIVLCMSERSLLAVLVPFAGPDELRAGFRQAVANLLARLEIPEESVHDELHAMTDIAFGSTSNRKVLGCLNEAALAVSMEFDSAHYRWLGDHALRLSWFIYSTTGYQPPSRLALELFQSARSDLSSAFVPVH